MAVQPIMMRDKIRLWLRFRLNSGRLGALPIDSDVHMNDVPSTPSREHIEVAHHAAVAAVSRAALVHEKGTFPWNPCPWDHRCRRMSRFAPVS